MGGAKLKSKYQTKENYRNVDSNIKVKEPTRNDKLPPTAGRKLKNVKMVTQQPGE